MPGCWDADGEGGNWPHSVRKWDLILGAKGNHQRTVEIQKDIEI